MWLPHGLWFILASAAADNRKSAVKAWVDSEYSGLCLHHFVEFNKKCYKYVDGLKDFNQAENNCKALGGFLAEPRSEEELNFIKALLRQNNAPSHVYIGGRVINGKWTWVTGGDVITYQPWRWVPSQPDGRRNCLILSANNFDFDDYYCYVANSASVCQAKVKGSSWIGPRDSFTNVKQYINLHQPSGNVNHSRRLCANAGGFIPKPRNPVEYEYLKTIAPNSTFVIGVNDHATEGVWMWDDEDTRVSWLPWMVWGYNRDIVNPSGGRFMQCVLSFEGWMDKIWWEARWIDTICRQLGPATTVVCEKKALCSCYKKAAKARSASDASKIQSPCLAKIAVGLALCLRISLI